MIKKLIDKTTGPVSQFFLSISNMKTL